MAEDPKKAAKDEAKAKAKADADKVKAEKKAAEDRLAEDKKHNSVLENATLSFNADRKKIDQEAFNAEMIEKGKVAKSTIKQLELNGSLMGGLEEGLGKMIASSDASLVEKAAMSESVRSIMNSNMDSAGIQAALQSLGKEVGHLPGAVKMLADSAKQGKKNESKLDKMKAKEAKQDEFKKKFSFKDNVEKVKAFSASAFDKIKGLILKGALFAIIMLLPKFLNSQLFQDILAAIKGDFSGLKQQFFDNFGKVIAGLTALFTIFFPGTMFFIIKSISGILINFAKGGFLQIIKAFGLLFKLMKFTFMKLIIAPIMALFTGLKAALVSMSVPFAPIIAIALLVAAAFFAIKILLEKLRDGLNVSSVSDVIKIGIGYLQDGFAAVANFIIDIANWIMEKLGKAAAFFGFDFDFGAPIGKMATNNAQVATDKAQLNKRIADAKKEAALAEEEKNQTASGGGAVMANNNNTTNVDQSSTTQVMPSEMPDMTQFANYGEVQLA